MTAPSWAEARKAEDDVIADFLPFAPSDVTDAMWKKIHAARHASDVALVRKVLAYAESVCESRRRSLHDNHQIMAALEAGKCGMAITSGGAEAVLAEIQKEEG